ncbi:MAG TPA: DUF4157 domain-containing protein, partial [Kofleriaceae bacterium]|nr:DUF4157 domain-containing protein [Kofleriaceae bacterium]
MEGAFGVGFSAVRIHEGPHAQALGALAYTQGTDIHFAPGRYQPNSQSGQELLGHELAHVVQQAQGRAPATAQAKGVDVNDDPSLEAEADAMGARAVRGERARGSGGALAPVAAATIQARRSSVVQRAMGMELETTVSIHGESGYHDPVYDNKTLGWKITSDDERMEFVTRPLETKSDLLMVIGQIQGFVTAAQRLTTSQKRVWIRELVREAGLPPGGEGAYQIGGSGFSPEQFVAKPQVTVGVPLDRVTRLLAEARTLDLQEYAKQEQEEHEGKGKGKDTGKGITVPKLLDDETARDDAPAPIDSLAVAAAWGEQMKRVNGQVDPASIDRATGLMALVLRYLNEGRFKSIRSGTAPYVKAYFPVMARTDFTSMFKAIGPAATLFTPHAVLACWGCDEEFAKQTPILLLGFKDDSRHGEKTEGTNFGPKIWDWLISIAGDQEEQGKINLRYKDQDNELIEHYRNSPDREFREGTARSKEKDLLSRGAVALNSTSMGLFPMDSREGVESLLTVLEFRQFPMEVGLAPEQWATLADRLFDFYERSRSQGAGLSDVLWTKNTLRSIRSNILRTTNAMRKTRDEQFNDEVLQLQVQALARLNKLDPRDHQALSEFVKRYSEATRKYQQRFLDLDKTKAPSLTKLSGGRQLR